MLINASFDLFADVCFTSASSVFIFSTLSITNLLLLPLFVLVLSLGFQEWRKQGSVPAPATSPSDRFVYHSIIMQLIVFVGFICYFCGGYIHVLDMIWAGLHIWSTVAHGQAMFHILTCVERYLAVVHPITYRGLRQAGGVRIINISTGCVWLLSFGWLTLCYLSNPALYFILYCSDMSFFLISICFCSVYVLCALRKPGPGEMGGNKGRVDHSKQRAFQTIIVIMGVLFIRFGWNLISLLISNAKILGPATYCLVVLSAFWVDLPSSLVLPLLFLHRRGKLRCCTRNPESE